MSHPEELIPNVRSLEGMRANLQASPRVLSSSRLLAHEFEQETSANKSITSSQNQSEGKATFDPCCFLGDDECIGNF